MGWQRATLGGHYVRKCDPVSQASLAVSVSSLRRGASRGNGSHRTRREHDGSKASRLDHVFGVVSLSRNRVVTERYPVPEKQA